jgi:hypothetical protein
MSIESDETVSGVLATHDKPAYVAPQLKMLDGSQTASGVVVGEYENSSYIDDPATS